ncbi:MAG: hypothetical protein EOO01_43140, partial [Chitinophagaceae bacterium]
METTVLEEKTSDKAFMRRVARFLLIQRLFIYPYLILTGVGIAAYFVIHFYEPQPYEFGKNSIEFIIGALAVFLGIYLSNVVEKWRRHKSEIAYASNLRVDLLSECKTIEENIKFRKEKDVEARKLIRFLTPATAQSNRQQIYSCTRFTSRRAFLCTVNKTIDQLEKTANLDIFRHTEITTSIIAYKARQEEIAQLQHIEEQILLDVRKASSMLLTAVGLEASFVDGKVVTPDLSFAVLLTEDVQVLNGMAVQLYYANAANVKLLGLCEAQKESCSDLRDEIKNKYGVS